MPPQVVAVSAVQMTLRAFFFLNCKLSPDTVDYNNDNSSRPFVVLLYGLCLRHMDVLPTCGVIEVIGVKSTLTKKAMLRNSYFVYLFNLK